MESIHLSDRLPTLQNTKLGWIVTGSLENERKKVCAIVTSIKPNISKTEDKCLTEAVIRFWEIET